MSKDTSNRRHKTRKDKISVVLPTYNEKDSIKKVIKEFEQLGVIDEIIVVNNNAIAGTSEEVAKTSAIEVFESVPGYGSAIQCGLKKASGDLVFICEPDDTFVAEDIFKFLAYIDDVDIVYGSRTISNFIGEGANMGAFLKIGNWAVAKLMQVLYRTSSLSDVGCTFRLLKRSAVLELQGSYRVKSGFFGPEMMLLARRRNITSVQIPVKYKSRVGVSSYTGDFSKAFVLGVKMIWFIITFPFRGYTE
ncbi:MAG TPA: glycosyltransferase family 2 protein [Candidatus Saccharimonadales bacterium]|nr:glycosyltransferase family 2 protein [Candidatus Saccharimonadales bacterium]